MDALECIKMVMMKRVNELLRVIESYCANCHIKINTFLKVNASLDVED